MKETASKVDILGIGVHPDDIELGCIGTLAKHQQMGYTFGIADLTGGELGTRGSKPLRLQEALAAAEVSKATFRVNLGMKDGYFAIEDNTINAIITVIRSSQPDIILANAIKDRHPDHGRAAKLVRQACFLSGLSKIETTDAEGNPQTAHRPKRVFHYIQDYTLEPDFAIDISDTIELKKAAIMAFSSQFFDPNSKEPSTPISSKDFFDFVEAKARVYGRQIGATFGEGFTYDTYMKVNDLFDTL
jgi:bacillithiol biosynthesis deacetylase BshB1